MGYHIKTNKPFKLVLDKGRGIFMFNDQKRKKRTTNQIKMLDCGGSTWDCPYSVGPTTSASAKSEEKPKFEFGIVPDVQYWDGDASGTRYYRNSVDKLMEASQTLNSEDVDLPFKQVI